MSEAVTKAQAIEKLSSEIRDARLKVDEEPSDENLSKLEELEEQFAKLNDDMQDVPTGGIQNELRATNAIPSK